MNGADRISEIRIRGMKACEDVVLCPNALTVLIGDNGSGKSTILEALELLSRAALDPDWLRSSFIRRHGGLEALLRQGSDELVLGVTIEGEGRPRLTYEIAIAASGSRTVIARETLDAHSGRETPLHVIQRTEDRTRVFDVTVKGLVSIEVTNELVLTHFGEAAQPHIARVKAILAKLDVHVPFAVGALWVPAERPSFSLRGAQPPEPTDALERLGHNLALCFHTLRNEHSERWPEILDRVRLGLGPEVGDIVTPFLGRGIELALRWQGLRKPIPAQSLSDGQLSFLAFVALVELGQDRLIAFDEPESHLHPMLLARVAWMLEAKAEHTPVIVTTHSDRFLDALSNPASSVVLCELDSRRATQLHRPDPTALAQWLERYRGLGEIRAEGYEAHVFHTPSVKAG
jgi:predicted ATPase